MDLFEKSRLYCATTTQFSHDFVIIGGKGCRALVLVRGEEKPRWMLDLSAQIGVNALGYGHPAVVKAITDQLGTGLIHECDNDWPNDKAVLLKERLATLAPGSSPKKVFLCSSGTEAINAAVKLAFDARPGRTALLSFKKAFNGRIGYSLDLTDSKPVQKEGFPPGSETVYQIPFPDRNWSEYDFSAWVKSVHFLDSSPLENIAAFVFELIQGEGGIRVADLRAMRYLDDCLREPNILMIPDEVQTGMGRTGKLFASQWYAFEPDIICLAKALGGGLPIGAVVYRAELDFKRPGRHSCTFGGNPTVASAALAVLEEVTKGGFLLEVKEKGEKFLSTKLEESAHKLSSNRGGISVRESGLGLMRKLEFRGPNGEPLPDLIKKIILQCLEKDLIVLSAGETAIRFLPPLIISREEILEGLEIFTKAAKEVLDG